MYTVFPNHLGVDVATPLSSSIEYSLQSTSSGVCITCNFLDSSATDCVAVVHQQLSHLSSSGLINIESSHKLTRSDDTAFSCIEGINLTEFHIGVIGTIQKTISIQQGLVTNRCLKKRTIHHDS